MRSAGRDTLRKAGVLAREHRLAESLAECALAIAPGFFSIETGVVDSELIGALEAALESLPSDDSVVRARLMGQLAMALYWSAGQERVRDLAISASAMAARLGSSDAKCHALVARFASLWRPQSFGDRVADAPKLVELADALGDGPLRLIAAVFSLTTLLEAGCATEAWTEKERLDRLVEQTRHPHAQWYPLMYRAMRAIMRGRFDEAQVAMQQFLEVGQRFEDVNVVHTFLMHSSELMWWRGRAAAIVDLVQAKLAEYPRLREWECALALLLAGAGRHDEARGRALGVLEEEGTSLLARMNGTLIVAVLAEVAIAIRDKDVAQRLVPLLRAITGRVVVAGYGVSCWGAVARSRGHVAHLLGETEAAERAYRAAIEIERDIGAVLWLARSKVALAGLLRERGGVFVEEAVSLAREGVEVARRVGALLLEQEGEVVLEASRC
jgi:hypothetical protein